MIYNYWYRYWKVIVVKERNFFCYSSLLLFWYIRWRFICTSEISKPSMSEYFHDLSLNIHNTCHLCRSGHKWKLFSFFLRFHHMTVKTKLILAKKSTRAKKWWLLWQKVISNLFQALHKEHYVSLLEIFSCLFVFEIPVW